MHSTLTRILALALLFVAVLAHSDGNAQTATGGVNIQQSSLNAVSNWIGSWMGTPDVPTDVEAIQSQPQDDVAINESSETVSVTTKSSGLQAIQKFVKRAHHMKGMMGMKMKPGEDCADMKKHPKTSKPHHPAAVPASPPPAGVELIVPAPAGVSNMKRHKERRAHRRQRAARMPETIFM